MFLLATLVASQFLSFAGDSAALIGEWQAKGYYYQDEFIDPTDKSFVLKYVFYQDGTDILTWHREGEIGFCERRGRWQVIDGILHDEVVWVNPENMMGCSSDPDMELGRKTETIFWRDQDKLYTEIPFGNDELVYLWQLVPSPLDAAGTN